MELDVLAAPLIIIAIFMFLIVLWYTAARTRTTKTPPYMLRQFVNNEWEIVCTFRDQSPSYAWGVECGILYERMQRVYEIRDNFHMVNKDQILDLIRRQDWTVKELSELPDDIFTLHIVDNVTPRPSVLPFQPPQDTFEPPTDWTPESDNDEDEGSTT